MSQKHLYKILAAYNTFMEANFDFLKTTPMQTVSDSKNTTWEVLAGNCFTCHNYHKNKKIPEYLQKL